MGIASEACVRATEPLHPLPRSNDNEIVSQFKTFPCWVYSTPIVHGAEADALPICT